MNLKFLPIGTVCLVENISKKQMIIGYSKSGYDYVAVEYPKGFENDNKLNYFNHNQVYELYSLGYKNEESRIFNGTLVSLQKVKLEEEEETIEELPTFMSTFSLEEGRIPQNEEKESFLPVEESPTLSQEEEEEGVSSVNEQPIEESHEENDTPIQSSLTFEESIESTTDSSLSDENRDEFTLVEESPIFQEESIGIPTFYEENLSSEEKEEELSENSISTIENIASEVEEESVIPEEDTEMKQEFQETTVLKINEDGVEEVVAKVPFVSDEDATIDITSVVAQIDNTEENDDSTETPTEPPKKEKRGLFHFGRK